MSVRCGNKAEHGGEQINHVDADAVRRCFAGRHPEDKPEPVVPAVLAPLNPVLLNHFGDPMHDDPCVCSPYDRCHGVRAQDAYMSGNWRDRFRAYND